VLNDNPLLNIFVSGLSHGIFERKQILFAMKKYRNMRLEAVTESENEYTHYSAFKKKDAAVRNIEIIVACVIAFMAGMGIYQVL
jgi:hypothetical protein